MKVDSSLPRDFKEKLAKYINTTFSKYDFVDMSLLESMVNITTHTNLQVDVLINRKGKVEDILVSAKDRADYSDIVKGNGLRLIHTVPKGDSTLSAVDKSILLSYGFDCICVVGCDKKAVDACVGFEKDGKVEIVKVPVLDYINKYGLLDKMKEYNDLREDNTDKDNTQSQQTAIIVMAEVDKDDNIESDLPELEGLATTAGIKVVDKLWQKRAKPDPKYMIGEGKLDELSQLVKLKNVDMVIFDNALNGSKINNLELALGVKVIDRSMLILDIFAMRAKTSEGKLQVELAQLKNSLPRLAGLSGTEGRFGGGVGMRGPGETKLELNKRIVMDKILKLEKQLKNVKVTRENNRKNRYSSNKKTVAIVGYTNSGKSTLMNLLTRENLYAKDELFATLDTTTRNLWLDKNTEILLIDTVGFINKLPHEFIDAFSSTLEETKYADMLMHVVDISDPNYEKQMAVAKDVLQKIGADAPVLTVFNKIDKLQDFEKENSKDVVYISAKKNIGIDQLKAKIISMVNKK